MPLTMNREVFITCAVTGSGGTQDRSRHVPALRALGVASAAQRVSLLNLAEYIVRLWGPPPKQKKPGNPPV